MKRKIVSLKKNYEFLRVYKKGSFFVGKFLILHVHPNRVGEKRIGVSISKKVGNSVKRNRIKRVIKENFREYYNTVDENKDYVFVARVGCSDATFTDIKREMKFLLKKLSVYVSERENDKKNSDISDKTI